MTISSYAQSNVTASSKNCNRFNLLSLEHNEILVSERLEFGNVWHLSPQDLNDLCGIVRLIISAVAVTQEKTVFEGVCDMTNGFQGKFFLECCFQ